MFTRSIQCQAVFSYFDSSWQFHYGRFYIFLIPHHKSNLNPSKDALLGSAFYFFAIAPEVYVTDLIFFYAMPRVVIYSFSPW